MRIVIDMQGAQAENHSRGIGRYTLAITKAMLRNSKSHEIIIVLNDAFPDSANHIREIFSKSLHSKNIRVWSPITPSAYIDNCNIARRKMNETMWIAYLDSLKPDVLFLPSLFEGFADDAVTFVNDESNYITVILLHDLIPYIHQDHYLKNSLVRDWYMEKFDLLKKSSLLLANSESTKLEGIKYLGFPSERSINIYADAEEHFKIIDVNADDLLRISENYGINKKFIMYTSGIDFRKNIEALIRSYGLLPKKIRQNYQLAIVCSVNDANRNHLISLAQAHGLRDGELILTGFVPEEDLIYLYNCCSLFVFPSWHEGFGLPVLEAMRCGVPVITSNLSSLPEVVGIEEATFDPHSDEAIASLMHRALTDESYRKRLISNAKKQSAKFSWDDSAQRAILAMEEAWDENNRRHLANPIKKLKPKLAYVSPLPPERSGISYYSSELLPVLADHYQIEVIVVKDRISDPWIQTHCYVRTVEWFLENARSFDRVIYHFGNSHFHQHMFGMLQAVPGVVVLHDFYLSGIAKYMQATGYAPGFFTQALYHSHGYAALQHMAKVKNINDIIFEYPTSRAVLENSVGTIVHSSNSVLLAKKYYNFDEASLHVIPHLRVPTSEIDHAVARQSLGFKEIDFVVCTFGLLGPTKLNDRLLRAWLASDLAQDKNCHLVFVGENDGGHYGAELLSTIQKSSCANRINITGWASKEIFETYLAAANIGVQLRTLSRGETSGTVLDCMNYELATIVNANGSMADLNDSLVWMLNDDFDDADLIDALEVLWRDSTRREIMGKKARQVILDEHNPDKCAQAYANSIERFYQRQPPILYDLYPTLAGHIEGKFNDEEMLKLAQNLATTFTPPKRSKQLLVDVSEFAQKDAKTGIQRVVRNILMEWLNNPPGEFRVEPVYATEDHGYRYARTFTTEFITGKNMGLADEAIDFFEGDIFFALDLNSDIQVAQSASFRQMQMRGVKVYFMVYDILRVQMPQHFYPGGKESFLLWLETVADADGAICISKTVAKDLNDWFISNNVKRASSFNLDWFHLGADLYNSRAIKVKINNDLSYIFQLKDYPTFLMVGTIEPRKGHLQVLEAFEKLWNSDCNINLVIIGKQGWMVDKLVLSLKSHPELNHRLFWLNSISDEHLEQVYAASNCLIMASYGEGFGLPLIEAAHRKLPIIARDIEIFREVADGYANFFKAEDPEELAQFINGWLELYKIGHHIRSDEMPYITWNQSAANLLSYITRPSLKTITGIEGISK